MKPRWDSELPADRTGEARPTRRQIRTVKHGETVYVILLAEPEGAYVHFVTQQNQTRPCTDPKCVHCDAGLPVQRAWYASALVQERDALGGTAWLRQVLLLTEMARRSLGDKAKRGAGLVLHRAGERPNGPLSATIEKEALQTIPRTPLPLPDPEDVRAVLNRVWGFPADALGQPTVLAGPWRKVQPA
jgi:hypothetical protein